MVATEEEPFAAVEVASEEEAQICLRDYAQAAERTLYLPRTVLPHDRGDGPTLSPLPPDPGYPPGPSDHPDRPELLLAISPLFLTLEREL